MCLLTLKIRNLYDRDRNSDKDGVIIWICLIGSGKKWVPRISVIYESGGKQFSVWMSQSTAPFPGNPRGAVLTGPAWKYHRDLVKYRTPYEQGAIQSLLAGSELIETPGKKEEKSENFAVIFSELCRAGWSSIKNCNTPTRDTTPADLLRGWFGRAALIESPPFVTSFRLDSIATPRRRRRTRYPTYLPNHPRLFYHNWWWVRYVEWSRTVTVSCAVENMSRRKQARPIRLLEDEENNASAVADTAAAVASPSFPTASAIGKSTFVTYLYADDTCFIVPAISHQPRFDRAT